MQMIIILKSIPLIKNPKIVNLPPFNVRSSTRETASNSRQYEGILVKVLSASPELKQKVKRQFSV